MLEKFKKGYWSRVQDILTELKDSPIGWFGKIGIFILIICATLLVLGLWVGMLMWPIWFAWGINNIFGTQIPLTFITWISTMIIMVGLRTIFRGIK